MPDAALAERLLAMAREDRAKREELVRRRELFGGYHPEMQAVHERNADALATIVDERGWPGRAMVGEEAAEAAWLVVQHAIGRPELQRRALKLLAEAVAAGEAEPGQLAMLGDRVRVFEGRPQLYGTHFDWDEAGQLSPGEIEDPEGVDARRAAVGLSPLAVRQAELRTQAEREGDAPPADRSARRAEFEAWLRETGWRREAAE